MTLKHCQGCTNDFYNGKNDLGVSRCFRFDKKKKLVTRIVIGFWQNPPYKNNRKVRIPPCYHGRGNNRYLYIKPEALDLEGFWR